MCTHPVGDLGDQHHVASHPGHLDGLVLLAQLSGVVLAEGKFAGSCLTPLDHGRLRFGDHFGD